MMEKQITGIVIIILNLAGLIFLVSTGSAALKKKFFSKRDEKDKSVMPIKRKKRDKKVKIDEDENEILQNLDLSDFDDFIFDDSD